MVALCSYCLDSCGPSEIIDVVNGHRMTLIKRASKWEVMESTGRKRAEALIARQGQIIEQIPGAVVVTDLDGYVTGWNSGAAIFYGYTPGEALGMHMSFVYPREEHEFLSKQMLATLKEKGSHEAEVRVRRKSGEEAYVHLYLSLLRDSNGSPTSIVGYGVDITEFRRAKEALRLAQEEFSKSFHSSPAPSVISTIQDGRFIDVNDSMVRTTGYHREEVIGHTSKELGLWLKPKERTKFVRMLRRQGVVQDLEVSFRMKWGETRVGLLSAQMINVRGEQCHLAMMHDITERKQAEEELKRSQEQLRSLSTYLQRAREEEREYIAREIHDELGQSLTALKMDLSWLVKRLPEDKEFLAEKVGVMSKLIDMTARTVKRISTQLRPGILADLGLVAAIEWQAEEFQKRTRTKCELSLQVEDVALDQELAMAFFRIFQEALTNIARHANATRVKVSLKMKANKLMLKVRDNGKGIEEEQISHPESLGLIGMRERARFWGGDVKIRGVQGRGTTVAVSIPLSLRGGI